MNLRISAPTCREVAEHLRRVGAHHLPVDNASAIIAAAILENVAQGIEAASAGETTKIGSTEGESPVRQDAPKGGRHDHT